MNILGHLHGTFVHLRRVNILSRLLSSHIPTGASVLDVGCGDGRLARALQAERPDIRIEGIEVRIRKDAAIPVIAFNGRRIPLGDGSRDVILLVDVLHHAADPTGLLKEALRTARSCVLIKDHVLRGPFAAARLRFMDWVGNARHGVRLPYRYWTSDEWQEAFEQTGATLESWTSPLRLYPFPADIIFGGFLHFIARLERA